MSFTPANAGPLEHLMRQLATLPGLGSRSARRIALHLLQKKDLAMRPLARALEDAADKVCECTQCGNLDMAQPCAVCRDTRRDESKLCVVAQVSDLWAIERTGVYKGRYVVLGGLLSALDGVGPDNLRVNMLTSKVRSRIDSGEALEVILALSATVDGQTTAHYLTDQLASLPVQITRLAHGVPVGGELDYLDEGTIITALRARSAA